MFLILPVTVFWHQQSNCLASRNNRIHNLWDRSAALYNTGYHRCGSEISVL